MIKYGLVVLFNVTMWGCYVNSLKALSSLQATVTNFAANFLSSGLAGFFLFKETLSVQVNHWMLFVPTLEILFFVYFASISSAVDMTHCELTMLEILSTEEQCKHSQI